MYQCWNTTLQPLHDQFQSNQTRSRNVCTYHPCQNGTWITIVLYWSTLYSAVVFTFTCRPLQIDFMFLGLLSDIYRPGRPAKKKNYYEYHYKVMNNIKTVLFFEKAPRWQILRTFRPRSFPVSVSQANVVALFARIHAWRCAMRICATEIHDHTH